MPTWNAHFKPTPGQTMGPNGTIQPGPSASVDSFLGLKSVGLQQNSWLMDYGNQDTDSFLKLLTHMTAPGNRGQFGGPNAAELEEMGRRTGLNPAVAGEYLRMRGNLNSGKARAFMGPDGAFQYLEQGQPEWDAAVANGTNYGTQLTGGGQYNPAVEAFRMGPQGTNGARTWRSDMASMNPRGVDGRSKITDIFRR